MISRVFELCCSLKSQDLIHIIKGNALGAFPDGKTMDKASTLIEASNKFIKGLSEQLIVQYCALNVQLASKQQVSGA